MNKYHKYLIFLAVLLFLPACSPDPRKEADAYATRAKADSASAAAEQQRQHAEELHAIEMEKEQIDLETKQATVENLRKGLNMLIRISSYFVTAALCLLLIMTTRTLNNTVQGVGEAIVVTAMLRANLIPLDYKTRQYPLLRQVHGTRWALSNPNDNSVMMLDIAQKADRQKIAAMGAVQLAGAIAVEARKSSDPASVAMIEPIVIEAQDGELLTGANLMAQISKTSQILAGGAKDEEL